MKSIKRLVFVALGALLFTLVAPAPAGAAKPSSSIIDASTPSVDISLFCGAEPGTVYFERTGEFRVTEFTDRQGELVRVRIGFNVGATITGPNGTAVQKIHGPDILATFEDGVASGTALGRNLWRLPDGSTLIGFAGKGEIAYFGEQIISFEPLHGQSDLNDFQKVCAAVS